MNIVLFGPPGSGKGTQGQLLAERYGYRHLATGTMIRDHIARGTAFGRSIENDIALGEFAPTDTISAMMFAELSLSGSRSPWALDGFPRNAEQAHQFAAWLSEGTVAGPTSLVAFALDLDDAEQRMLGRTTCKVCGSVYHATYVPARDSGKCDNGCGTLVHRPEDDPNAIVRRLEIFEQVTLGVLAVLSSSMQVVKIDAINTIEQTLNTIVFSLGLHRTAIV